MGKIGMSPTYVRDTVPHGVRWDNSGTDENGKPDKKNQMSMNRLTNSMNRNRGDEWAFYAKMRAGLMPGDPNW
jgi:hypothetical protein